MSVSVRMAAANSILLKNNVIDGVVAVRICVAR